MPIPVLAAIVGLIGVLIASGLKFLEVWFTKSLEMRNKREELAYQSSLSKEKSTQESGLSSLLEAAEEPTREAEADAKSTQGSGAPRKLWIRLAVRFVAWAVLFGIAAWVLLLASTCSAENREKKKLGLVYERPADGRLASGIEADISAAEIASRSDDAGFVLPPSSPESLALRQLADRDVERAIATVSSAGETTDADRLFLRSMIAGRAEVFAGRPWLAVPHFESALALRPDDLAALRHLVGTSTMTGHGLEVLPSAASLVGICRARYGDESLDCASALNLLGAAEHVAAIQSAAGPETVSHLAKSDDAYGEAYKILKSMVPVPEHAVAEVRANQAEAIAGKDPGKALEYLAYCRSVFLKEDGANSYAYLTSTVNAVAVERAVLEAAVVPTTETLLKARSNRLVEMQKSMNSIVPALERAKSTNPTLFAQGYEVIAGLRFDAGASREAIAASDQVLASFTLSRIEGHADIKLQALYVAAASSERLGEYEAAASYASQIPSIAAQLRQPFSPLALRSRLLRERSLLRLRKRPDTSGKAAMEVIEQLKRVGATPVTETWKQAEQLAAGRTAIP